jgi:hypothetical protein
LLAIASLLLAAVMPFMAHAAGTEPLRKVTGSITTRNLVPSGACTPGGCVEADVSTAGAARIQVENTWAATGGLVVQYTLNGVNWYTAAPTPLVPLVAEDTAVAAIASASTGIWRVDVAGAVRMRVTAKDGAVSGQADITIQPVEQSLGGTATITGGGGAGDASAANQVTGNASLASIDGKTPALGTQSIANSRSVTPATSATWAATQSGNWSTRLQDGSGNASTSRAAGSARPIDMAIVDASGNQITSFGGNVAGTTAHDGSASAVNPVLTGCYASAAAPTNVSADTDAVRVWCLRSGAMVFQQTFAGTLSSAGSGAVDAGTARTTQASDSPLVLALGAAADSVCPTDTGTCNALQVLKRIAQQISANPTAAGSVSAGTAGTNSLLGGCVYSSTPPTLTNGQQVAVQCSAAGRALVDIQTTAIAAHGHGATGSAVPANATLAGGRSGANMVAIPVPDTTVAVELTSATTTQMVALASSQKIYVGSFSLISSGAANVKWVYGTGSNCGTGTTDLTKSWPLAANVGLAMGGGIGAVLIVPASQALCLVSDAAVNVRGHATYTQY